MFPEDFTKRMKEMLQEEYQAFEEALEEERYCALRVNTLKAGKEEFLKKAPWNLNEVPWEENGFYYSRSDTPGKHPYHEAGAYYIQEPSAMAPAAFLDAKPGERILDLCAAPGGKSTQIAVSMKREGLLISNEIHPARAKILSENVERLGIKNCLVMNETPDHLAQIFHEFFDRIMVDAPCSGEGMFRKNEEACGQWSVDAVEQCAKRQKDILEAACGMLKPGGRMVYSTCTFSKEENEDVIEQFIGQHPEYHLVEMNLVGGMMKGYDKEGKTIRLFPHRLHGEGHFVAVLEKEAGLALDECSTKTEATLSEKEIKDYREFEEKVLQDRLEGTFIKYKDELYLAKANIPGLKGLKVLRPGIHLGTLKKGRFEPGHALAHCLTPEDVKPAYRSNFSADDPVIRDYLHGQTFETQGENGWHVIFVDGYSLGWGKLTGNIMKNHYPKGLRSKY